MALIINSVIEKLEATSSQFNFNPNYVTAPSRHNEKHLQILHAVESHPELMRRDLANELLVSLGKARNCMKALIERCAVKMGNKSHNQKKLDYTYLLMRDGSKNEAALTTHFLKRKTTDYTLKRELENISGVLKEVADVAGSSGADADSDAMPNQMPSLERQRA
jgi:EPS-associated MarR family transcriptional regulator